jgi:fimbrial chaperone protein
MTSRLALPLASVLLLAPLAAAAAELEISPVLVELSAERRTALLTLRNAGSTAARFQAKAFAWTQKADGTMNLEPTRSLVLFPPLVELEPGESRTLRVGTEAAPDAVERSWRVVVEELPWRDQAPAGIAVRVLTRVGLPAFLAPRETRRKGEIAFLDRDGKRVLFALRNGGTVRLQPTSVALALVSARGEKLFERQLDSWYVLAREERVWDVAVPREACEKAAEVVVTATLEADAVVGRAAGGCRAR